MVDPIRRIYEIERVLEDAYTQSTSMKYNRYPYLNFAPIVQAAGSKQKRSEELRKYFKDVGDLGVYEAALLTSLLPPRANTVTVVVGGRGCGKTATLQFLEKFMRTRWQAALREYQQPILIYIDTNDCTVDSKRGKRLQVQDCLGSLYEFLFNQLWNILFERYWHIFSTFLKEMSNPAYTCKHGFLVNKLARLFRVELASPAYSKDEASIFLERLVDRMRLSPVNKYRMALDLVAEVKRLNRLDVLYLCLDNIDQYDNVIQSDFLYNTVTAVNKSQLPVLIPMRPQTARLGHRYLAVRQGAMINGLLPHSGVTPLKEAQVRTSHLLEAAKHEGPLAAIDETHVAALLCKAAEIFATFRDVAFKEFFQAICGFSVQRGLVFARHCYHYLKPHMLDFHEDIQPAEIAEVLRIAKLHTGISIAPAMKAIGEVVENMYRSRKRTSPSHYHYVHMLLSHGTREVEDYGAIVQNVFYDCAKGRRDSIKYLMLTILENKRIASNTPEQLGRLEAICLERGYSRRQIRMNLNELLTVGRRLIWTTGPDSINADTDFSTYADEEIGLTVTGIDYLSKLSKNLDYVGFMLAETTHDKDMILGKTLASRMCMVARLVYEAASVELGRYIRDREGKGDTDPDSMSNSEELLLFSRLGGPVLSKVHASLRAHIWNITDRKPLAALDQETKKYLALDFDQIGEVAREHHNYATKCVKQSIVMPQSMMALEWPSLPYFNEFIESDYSQ